MRGRPRGSALGLSSAIALVVLLMATPAYAGRLIATGHDADHHCANGSGQCHYLKVAVDYIRAAAPNPNKPVLVLDNGSLDLQKALDLAYPPAGSLPRVVMDPGSPAFASAPLNTSLYSAILVASDYSCGGCDLNRSGSPTDSMAIAARKGDIASFFNSGGGILALAGASHGGSSSPPDNTYYSFVPLPVGGAPVNPPFTLTSTGAMLGFTDTPGMSDINCCPTHNSFTLPPAGSALAVAETDSMGLAETLVAEGSISGAGITKTPPPPAGGLPPAFGKMGVIGIPPATKCLSKRHFKIHIRKHAGLVYTSANVFVQGKPVGAITGAKLTRGVDLRGLPQGTFVVKIVVITTGGNVIQGKRTYHTCAPKRLPGHPHLL